MVAFSKTVQLHRKYTFLEENRTKFAHKDGKNFAFPGLTQN